MNQRQDNQKASDASDEDARTKRRGRPPTVALEILVDLYRFKSIRGVAKEAHITPQAVRMRLKSHGIPRRPVGRPPIDEDLTEFDQLLLSDSPRLKAASKDQIADWRARGVKRCKFCREEKPLDEFWKGSGVLGRTTACKTCAGRQAALRSRLRYRTDGGFRQYKKDRAASDRVKHWKRRGWSESNACALDRNTNPDLPFSHCLLILEATNDRCACCGRTAEEIQINDKRSVPMTPEHATPICEGAAHDVSNVQALCFACNRSKGMQAIDYLGDIRDELIRKAEDLD